jgi:hypothetical protein
MFDPSAPCGNYFPIIYGRGNVTLTGTGQGQGILLIEGTFSNRGTFDFAGIVIVNGDADFRGTMRNMGGILADTTTSINGTADLEYSSCAVERAILENSNATRLIPLRERGWIDISSISY